MHERGIVTPGEGGSYIDVQVQPGAHRPRVVGRHGDALKIAVAAPPVGGRANEGVVKALAELLGVEASAVSVATGETSRRKRLFVSGLDAKAAQLAVDAALAPGSPNQRR